MIIGLTGYSKSGKDTLADYLVARHNFTRYGFADPIKKGVKVMFQFTNNQLYGKEKDKIDERYGLMPRDVLQIFGTEVMQSLFPNLFPKFKEKVGREFWSRQFEIKYEQDESIDYVISDVRFPHEVDMIHRLGGKVYRINREEVIPCEENLHESELLIPQLDIDQEIDNNGTLKELFDNWEAL